MRLIFVLLFCFSSGQYVSAQELYTQHIIKAFQQSTLPQLLISHPEYGNVIIGSGRERSGPYDLFVLRTNEVGDVVQKDTLDRIGVFHIDYSASYVWLNDSIAAIPEYKIRADSEKLMILVDVKNCRFHEEMVMDHFDGSRFYLSSVGMQNYKDQYIIAGHTGAENAQKNTARYTILDSSFQTIEDYEFQIEGRSTVIRELLNIGDSTIVFLGSNDSIKVNGRRGSEIFVAKRFSPFALEVIYVDDFPDMAGSGNAIEAHLLPSGDFIFSYNRFYEITEDSFFYDTYIQQKMMRMTLEGEIVWDKVMGWGHPSYGDRIYRIIPSNDDDNYIYCAEQSSLDFNFQDTVFAGGIYDENGDTISYFGVISKFDEDGNEIWHRSYRYWNNLIFGTNNFTDIAQRADEKGYDLVGYSNRSLAPPNSTYAWLWKMSVDNYGCIVPGCHLPSSTTGPLDEMEFKIYPNPATNQVYILNNGAFEYRLLDSNGSELTKLRSRSADETIILDVSSYPSGTYFISKCKGGNCQTEKLLKI